MDILQALELGHEIRDYNDNIIEDFMFVGHHQARIIRQTTTKQIIKNYLNTKEVHQITTTTPTARKSFNWSVVDNKCIKWQMDTVYLGNYLKNELGWTSKKKDMKQSAVIPNSHAIIMFNKRIFVVFIHN